jgi:hypothetical protein
VVERADVVILCVTGAPQVGHVVNDPEFKKNVIGRTPPGRIADPKDVVGPVQFFCAPASDFRHRTGPPRRRRAHRMSVPRNLGADPSASREK